MRDCSQYFMKKMYQVPTDMMRQKDDRAAGNEVALAPELSQTVRVGCTAQRPAAGGGGGGRRGAGAAAAARSRTGAAAAD